MRTRSWIACWVLLCGAGCGGDASPGEGPVEDAGDRDAGDGGSAADASSDAGGDAGGDAAIDAGGGISTAAPGDDPLIPEPSGECPEFVSGSQTIMGLETEILAGEPGETMGPLLFVWHGTNGTGPLGLRQVPDSVKDEILAQGGIVIAPSSTMMKRDGNDVTFVLGVWYDGADLAYADHLVACAVRNHNVDPRRIYVTGCSAGGLMAGVMSIMRSSYVAAVAPNSGGVALAAYAFDDAEHAAAALAMHGGEDDTVYINFADASRTYLDMVLEAGGFGVECNHAMGHCGAPGALYESAWTFMKAHPYGVAERPYEAGLPSDFPEYCAVYEGQPEP